MLYKIHKNDGFLIHVDFSTYVQSKYTKLCRRAVNPDSSNSATFNNNYLDLLKANLEPADSTLTTITYIIQYMYPLQLCEIFLVLLLTRKNIFIVLKQKMHRLTKS